MNKKALFFSEESPLGIIHGSVPIVNKIQTTKMEIVLSLHSLTRFYSIAIQFSPIVLII